MNIRHIYHQFKTPKNLQQHMLRVAALAQLITSNWTGPKLDTNQIIVACALHDLAKPIVFDLTSQNQFIKSEKELEKLKQLQKFLIENYGSNEHQATVKICRQQGCQPTTIDILNKIEWTYVNKLIQDNDYNALIAMYCDMRIAPNGILPIVDRFADLQARKKDKKINITIQDGNRVEELLQNYSQINLNTISNDQLNSRISKILKLGI